MTKIKGNNVLITGGASGIGRIMGRMALEKGAKSLIIWDINEANIATTIEEFAPIGRVKGYRVDVGNIEAIREAYAIAVKECGDIDILINNAGTGAVAPAEDITDDQFANEMEIDLFGTFKVARAVAKTAMIPAKYGRIINIASMYGLVGNKVAGSAPYHAAKGGVVNLTRALAAEWGKYGITVNSICPGYFYTPLTVDTLNSDFFQQNAKTMIPEERYGNEGELDTAAIFLASEASSYVTGVNLPVDGGYTCM